MLDILNTQREKIIRQADLATPTEEPRPKLFDLPRRAHDEVSDIPPKIAIRDFRKLRRTIASRPLPPPHLTQRLSNLHKHIRNTLNPNQYRAFRRQFKKGA